MADDGWRRGWDRAGSDRTALRRRPPLLCMLWVVCVHVCVLPDRALYCTYSVALSHSRGWACRACQLSIAGRSHESVTSRISRSG